jgi:hypothetical protein
MNNAAKVIALTLAVLVIGGWSNKPKGTSYEPVSDKLPTLTVSFSDSLWDGKKIPKGQQCSRDSGNANTPPLRVENIPEGVNAIIVEFNDESYQPLSYAGGHGKIGFWTNGKSSIDLPPQPAETKNLNDGAWVEAPDRGFNGTAYLPPCSGGRGNFYSAEVKAVYKNNDPNGQSKLYAKGYIGLGRW